MPPLQPKERGRRPKEQGPPQERGPGCEPERELQPVPEWEPERVPQRAPKTESERDSGREPEREEREAEIPLALQEPGWE